MGFFSWNSFSQLYLIGIISSIFFVFKFIQHLLNFLYFFTPLEQDPLKLNDIQLKISINGFLFIDFGFYLLNLFGVGRSYI